MAWGNEIRRRTFQCWSDMKQRCYNMSHKQYKNYGGRGICVCARWLNSFDNFIADMGEKPSGMTLDRIDNDGWYSAENCRWAHIKVQCNNQRRNVRIERDGTTITAAQLARQLGLHPSTVRRRIKAGWRKEDVFDSRRQFRGRTSAPRIYEARNGGGDGN